MNNEKEIDIPFGAFDSELYYQEIYIPDGFKATIEDNKIILKRKESEDERIRKAIIEFFELQDDNTTYSFVSKKDILAWLEKQKEHWSEEDDQHMSKCIGAIAAKDGWTFAEKVEEKHWIQSLKQRIKG